MRLWRLHELTTVRRSSGESILEYTLGTRVMTGVCIIGQALSYIVDVDSDPSAMLLFVLMLGVVFWKGVYDDMIRLIEAMIVNNPQDRRFFIVVGAFDTLLFIVSVPLLWRLPAYGNSLYAIAIVPVAVPVILLSLYRLYLTVQGVLQSRE